MGNYFNPFSYFFGETTKTYNYPNHNILNDIKSQYILKAIFNNFSEKRKLNLIKYNKYYHEKILQMPLKNFIEKNGFIEKDLKIKEKKDDENKYNVFCFINSKYVKFCTIFFDDNPKKIKRNYIYKNEKISKIKIYMYKNY